MRFTFRPGVSLWLSQWGWQAVRSLAFFCLLLSFGALTLDAADRDKPNIVLIVSDDQGYGDSTAYWKTDLQTPVMDEIGRNGIRFTQFRVNPLCAPTRASIMTGLYSLEAGMWRGPGANDKEEPEGGWPSSA